MPIIARFRLIASLCCCLGFLSAAYSQQETNWKTHLQDDFQSKNTKPYRIDGKVDWSSGKVVVREKSALAFPAQIGKVFFGAQWKIDFEISPKKPKSPQPALLEIRFRLGRTAGRVQFLATIRNGQSLEKIQIIEETSNALPYPIRQEILAVGASQNPFQGKWTIVYNHGLVTLLRDGKSLLRGSIHLPNGSELETTPLFDFEMKSFAAEWNCKKLVFSASEPQIVASKSRQDALKANQLDELFKKLALSGSWHQALTVAKKVLQLRQKILGEQHYLTARAHHHLGMSQCELGQWKAARKSLETARAIFVKVAGDGHPVVIPTQLILGQTMEQLGGSQENFRLLQSSYALAQKAYSSLHPVTANTLFALAEWYESKGDYARAQQLHHEVSAIRHKLVNIRPTASWPQVSIHKSIAQSLSALALGDLRNRKLADADAKYMQALDIAEKIYGPNLPAAADQRRPLGFLGKLRGDWKTAEQQYRLVLLACQQTLGMEHPQTATAAIDLADTLLRKPKPTAVETIEATKLINHALKTQREWMQRMSAAPSVPSRWAGVVDYRTSLSVLASLVVQGKLPPEFGYEHFLQGDNAHLLSDQWFRNVAASTNDKATASEFRQTSFALAGMAYGSRRHNAAPEFAKLVKQIESYQAKLEKLTKLRSPQTQTTSVNGLQKAMPAKCVVLHFVNYANYEANPKSKTPITQQRLAAFVITKGNSVSVVDCGPTQPISKLVRDWRMSIGTPAGETARSELRALIWNPLSKIIANAATVFVVPDGPMRQLPLGILPGEKSRTYLFEKVHFAYVPMTRTLEMLLKEPISTVNMRMNGDALRQATKHGNVMAPPLQWPVHAEFVLTEKELLHQQPNYRVLPTAELVDHPRLPDLRKLNTVFVSTNANQPREMRFQQLALPFAFVIAGADTVIAPLWPVDEKAAKEMEQIYTGFTKKKLSKIEALRKAKLALKEKYPHPTNWMPWMLTGHPGNMPTPNIAQSRDKKLPILRSKGFPFLPATVAGIVAVLLVVGTVLWRRRKVVA